MTRRSVLQNYLEFSHAIIKINLYSINHFHYIWMHCGHRVNDTYVVGSRSFPPDQLFKVTEIKQICHFSTQSPFTSTHFSNDTITSPQMALYIPHSVFHLARLLHVRPETFGPYHVRVKKKMGDENCQEGQAVTSLRKEI